MRCDLHHLPFRSGVFNLVYCSHVLEHVLHPAVVVGELRRVAGSQLIIKVPNRITIFDEESKDHLYTWTPGSLENLLRKYFSHVEIHTWTRRIRGRFLREIPLIGYPLIRVLNRLIKNEIVAMCRT